jgi:2-polyprenyl-3-methyl-5-hydroxy-6-metoxy-1,4-benzoquinol methylase
MPGQSAAMSAGEAIDAIEAAVRGDATERDLAYFVEHRDRFELTAQRIAELVEPGGRVLDVGSHYLHLASTLRAMGFRVAAVDAPAFASLEQMRKRAARYEIDNQPVERLDAGEFMIGMTNAFDIVVFTEILEHITFNPVRFWQRIYEILNVGGAIYLTTPNALTPWKILHLLKRLSTFRGVGITAPEIFHTVTYGHHWKEYSASEICEYFSRLSPDFSVTIRRFNYPASVESRSGSSFKTVMRRAVHRAASAVPALRDQIEAVIRLERRTEWLIEPPSFI